MKLNKTEIRKIVVFRALQIGDMLCSIPAIRALRHAYPNAEITLIGLPWSKMLIDRFSNYFNSSIIFPGYPGFPEQPVDRLAFPGFLKQVQEQNFDLAIQMQGSGIISNPLVDLFAAKHTAGFYSEKNYCPNKELYIKYPSTSHEVHRHLELIESLGITEFTEDLEFPILAKDEEEFKLAALPIQPQDYVVIHPGSRGVSRQWSPENFAAVADDCIENGLKVVITGTKDEAEIVENVLGFMKHKAINAAGKTSLGAVAVLIRDAAALVSNCTGVAHIAAGLKTKSIVVSLDVEPSRWSPLNKTLHRTIIWADTPSLGLVRDELKSLLFNQ